MRLKVMRSMVAPARFRMLTGCSSIWPSSLLVAAYDPILKWCTPAPCTGDSAKVERPDVRQVERCRDQMAIGGYPSELGEAVEALLRLLIVRKWQRVDGGLADLVDQALGEEQLPRHDGTLEVDPGSGGLQAAKLPASDAEF